jgi:hypothetical protein
MHKSRYRFSVCAVLLAGSLQAPPAAAHPAWGIVIDPQGRVVFSEVETNTIWRLENGRPVPILRGKHSHEIHVDAAGNLYGEHLAYRQAGERWLLSLWRLTPDGREVQLAPPSDTVELPRGLGSLRDRQGNTYAFRDSFQRVDAVELYRRSPAGEAVFLAGGPPGHADGRGAAARFTGIQGKVLGADGALYVTDGATVRRISPDGMVTTVGGDPLAGVSHGERPRLLGLAVGRRGEVLVADYDHRSVREIGSDGHVREVWRSGRYWAPSGVAAGGGAVYVLEARPEALGFLGRSAPFARVWRLGPGGSRTLLATVGRWNPTIAWAPLLVIGAAAGLLTLRRRRRGPAAAQPGRM